MYNAPVESNSINTRDQGGPTKGGFCTLRNGSPGTYCPGGQAQVCIGNYPCTFCANC